MLYEMNKYEFLNCRLNLDLFYKNLIKQKTLSYFKTLHALIFINEIIYCDKNMHVTMTDRTLNLID